LNDSQPQRKQTGTYHSAAKYPGCEIYHLLWNIKHMSVGIQQTLIAH